jgi:hypothetical protein
MLDSLSPARSGLRYRIWVGVPRWVRRETQRVLEGLRVLSPATTPVHVDVVPAPSVADGQGGYGFGATVIGISKTPVRIYIAGQLGAVKGDHRLSQRTIRRYLGETICHEWAHYEQFRDGRPVIERGVRVRAASLYRRLPK